MKISQVLSGLASKFPVVEDPDLKPLVNFSQNRRLPIHSWFDYKQGYSPELITRLADEAGLKKDEWVVDPFNGVGTTLIALNSLGINGVGFDVNPVANLAARVKCRTYTKSEIRILEEWISTTNFSTLPPAPKPNYKSLPRIFSNDQLNQLLRIKAAIDLLAQTKLREFFLLVYVSIIEPVSNRVKDGNGIKISKTKKPIQDVYATFREQAESMVADLKGRKVEHYEMRVIEDSLIKSDSWVDENTGKFKAAIFSPPYANCFDYLEVYKMEMWMGGFVTEYSDFAQYRNASVRSHVNSSFSKDLRRKFESVEVIAKTLEATELWNRNIPDMVRGYFDDMHELMVRLHRVLEKSGSVFIVVANSSYRGVIVPTDLLLAESATSIGFEVSAIRKARQIRGSSQHMAQKHANSDLMRESVIILTKK